MSTEKPVFPPFDKPFPIPGSGPDRAIQVCSEQVDPPSLEKTDDRLRRKPITILIAGRHQTAAWSAGLHQVLNARETTAVMGQLEDIHRSGIFTEQSSDSGPLEISGQQHAPGAVRTPQHHQGPVIFRSAFVAGRKTPAAEPAQKGSLPTPGNASGMECRLRRWFGAAICRADPADARTRIPRPGSDPE